MGDQAAVGLEIARALNNGANDPQSDANDGYRSDVDRGQLSAIHKSALSNQITGFRHTSSGNKKARALGSGFLLLSRLEAEVGAAGQNGTKQADDYDE